MSEALFHILSSIFNLIWPFFLVIYNNIHAHTFKQENIYMITMDIFMNDRLFYIFTNKRCQFMCCLCRVSVHKPINGENKSRKVAKGKKRGVGGEWGKGELTGRRCA